MIALSVGFMGLAVNARMEPGEIIVGPGFTTTVKVGGINQSLRLDTTSDLTWAINDNKMRQSSSSTLQSAAHKYRKFDDQCSIENYSVFDSEMSIGETKWSEEIATVRGSTDGVLSLKMTSPLVKQVGSFYIRPSNMNWKMKFGGSSEVLSYCDGTTYVASIVETMQPVWAVNGGVTITEQDRATLEVQNVNWVIDTGSVDPSFPPAVINHIKQLLEPHRIEEGVYDCKCMSDSVTINVRIQLAEDGSTNYEMIFDMNQYIQEVDGKCQFIAKSSENDEVGILGPFKGMVSIFDSKENKISFCYESAPSAAPLENTIRDVSVALAAPSNSATVSTTPIPNSAQSMQSWIISVCVISAVLLFI